MTTPQEIAEEREAEVIETFRRYSKATRGTPGEVPQIEKALAAYDGKPITPLQYWVRRATVAEEKAATRKTPVFAMSMMFAAGFITGSFAVVIAYFM